MHPATTQPFTPEARNFFDAATDLLAQLYGRWLDEKEYEDINDYAVPLQRVADRFGVKVDKMHARPFGCTFSVAGKTFKAACTTRSCSYKRIA